MPINQSINIKKIKESLEADVIVGDDLTGVSAKHIYASDLMSDVLAYGKTGSVLLTGLNTIQAVISSYMAEFIAIIFLRGKKPGSDMQKFAKDKDITILSTKADMYEACIKIARIDGNLPITEGVPIHTKEEDNITSHEFKIDGHDFASAGMVSTQIKSILKTIGYDPLIIRRIAISTYEGEMNVVMHAIRAKVTLNAGNKEIVVIIDDEGKGIPDVERAMQQGYSTATEEQRALGFGSGMGLPNIKKNSDLLNVTSEIGKGTKLEIKFFVK